MQLQNGRSLKHKTKQGGWRRRPRFCLPLRGKLLSRHFVEWAKCVARCFVALMLRANDDSAVKIVADTQRNQGRILIKEPSVVCGFNQNFLKLQMDTSLWIHKLFLEVLMGSLSFWICFHTQQVPLEREEHWCNVRLSVCPTVPWPFLRRFLFSYHLMQFWWTLEKKLFHQMITISLPVFIFPVSWCSMT